MFDIKLILKILITSAYKKFVNSKKSKAKVKS